MMGETQELTEETERAESPFVTPTFGPPVPGMASNLTFVKGSTWTVGHDPGSGCHCSRDHARWQRGGSQFWESSGRK